MLKHSTIVKLDEWYEQRHENGLVVRFTIEEPGQLTDSWLADRLAYFDEHGTMEGY